MNASIDDDTKGTSAHRVRGGFDVRTGDTGATQAFRRHRDHAAERRHAAGHHGLLRVIKSK